MGVNALIGVGQGDYSHGDSFLPDLPGKYILDL